MELGGDERNENALLAAFSEVAQISLVILVVAALFAYLPLHPILLLINPQ
jgi:hypothetical protein